jgi:hypothetical protein
MTRSEIKFLNGGPTLLIDGQPVFPMLHWVPTPPIEGKWIGEKILKDFSDAGVHLITFGIGIRDYLNAYMNKYAITDIKDIRKVIGALSFFERKDFTFDFSKLDKQIGTILKIDPNAYMLLRIHFEMGSPLSLSPFFDRMWRERNPEELEVYEDGRAETQSYASKKWLQDSSGFLSSLIQHLRSSENGVRVIGVMPCAGHAGEWVKESAMENYAADYSEVMKNAFREWLIEKYKNLENLRKAWHDPYAHFNKVEIPTAEEQVNADTYQFRDPSKYRRAIDYFEFFSDLVADDIIYLCQTIKEASDGSMLAGVFYGYLLGAAWCNWYFDQGKNMKTSAYQRSGHLSLSKVLNSPYVDFIASPYCYGFRGICGDSAPMSIVESIRLHGKMYFIEDDTRTHLFPPDSKYGMARNLKETLSILTRTFGRALTSSSGLWYADWCSPDRPGPYQDEKIMEQIRKMLKIGEKSLNMDRSPAGEIAVIVNEKSFVYERMNRNLDWPLIFEQKFWLSRIGAPCDFYLLEDLEKLPEQYKCYIFLNAFYLNDEQRKIIRRTAQKSGKTLVWLFASGLINEDVKAENMKDITGINFVCDWTEWSVKLFISNFNHPITRDLPPTIFGTDFSIGPIPYIDDPDATILGTLIYSRGMCVPGMAVKEFSGWKSIYIGAPNVPPNIFRSIAKYAGVHIYNYSEDVLYASRNFICIHAVKPGEKQIFLPRKADVYDEIKNKLIARNANIFVDVMETGETKLYLYM